MAIVWRGGAVWSAGFEGPPRGGGGGEKKALKDGSGNRLFFRRLCVSQEPCRELWTHLTRPGQYRPAGKGTRTVCLASLLYDVSRCGMGTARSHAAGCRYKVCTSCMRPC